MFKKVYLINNLLIKFTYDIDAKYWRNARCENLFNTYSRCRTLVAKYFEISWILIQQILAISWLLPIVLPQHAVVTNTISPPITRIVFTLSLAINTGRLNWEQGFQVLQNLYQPQNLFPLSFP